VIIVVVVVAAAVTVVMIMVAEVEYRRGEAPSYKWKDICKSTMKNPNLVGTD
jgi:hypothetical protein